MYSVVVVTDYKQQVTDYITHDVSKKSQLLRKKVPMFSLHFCLSVVCAAGHDVTTWKFTESWSEKKEVFFSFTEQRQYQHRCTEILTHGVLLLQTPYCI